MRLRIGFVVFLMAAAYGPPLIAAETNYLGLLRARDLTTFGFLRLDMRPAHAINAPKGTWAIETELAHQNTWALSEGAEKYIEALPGRRELGAAELAEIEALPGENFLFDMELAELDVTLHYKFSDRWGGYLVLSGVNYSGGFLDGAIESFHDLTGFDSGGRPNVRRNDVTLFADLKSANLAFLGAPTHGGLLDPTIGIRYSSDRQMKGWDVVVEAAAKVAIRGQENFLSTGKSDYGLQATLQRFSDHHAWYVSASGVYYDGSTNMTPTGAQIVPTLVVGYERRTQSENAPHPAGIREQQRVFARGHRPAGTARYQIPAEPRRLPSFQSRRLFVCDHRKPAEFQQHAGYRPAARLGVQSGPRNGKD